MASRTVDVYIDSHTCANHNAELGAFEASEHILDRPARTAELVAAIGELDDDPASGVTAIECAREIDDGTLAAVVSAAYLAYAGEKEAEAAAEAEGARVVALDADATTVVGRGSMAMARRAAGCVAAAVAGAVEAGMGGPVCVAVARPPGHHNACNAALEAAYGGPEEGDAGNFVYGCSGGCILPNIPLALAALDVRPSRTVVVDVDAHFADGTAWMAAADDDVLTISIHEAQPGFFPFAQGTEAESTAGNINFPLPPGSGDAAAAAALDRALAAASTFDPHLVVVALGFDGLATDPASSLTLTPDGLAGMVHAIAAAFHPRPLVLVLEGGYDPPAVAAAFRAVVAALTRLPSQTAHPTRLPAS